MLIELLSMSNYVHFNVKLAHILGLNSAIYLGQITDINEKAIRKNKVDENFFTIDREYITSRTTISEKEQREIENNLIKIGILERSEKDSNTLLLNLTVLTSILMSPDEDLIKNVSNLAKPKKGKTKSEKIIENLKENIITLNPELRQAYFDWIDAVYAKDGFMTKAAVVAAQGTVDKFSNRNLDIALKVLQIASINGYRDITWAINNYNKDYRVNYTVAQTSAKASASDVPPVRKRINSSVVF